MYSKSDLSRKEVKLRLEKTPVSPPSEKERHHLSNALAAPRTEGRKELEQLDGQRAGTDRLREQSLEILRRWLISGYVRIIWRSTSYRASWKITPKQ